MSPVKGFCRIDSVSYERIAYEDAKSRISMTIFYEDNEQISLEIVVNSRVSTYKHAMEVIEKYFKGDIKMLV